MNISSTSLSTGISSYQPSQQTELSLWFTSDQRIELIKTNFRSPLLHKEVCAVRGKTAGAFATTTFQWTSAVQALSVLLLRALERVKRGILSKEPLLEGGKRSLASSLDASLYKQTLWLDLFGSNAHGESLSKRILPRTNPGRRRLGPVTISLNERLLPSTAIKVFVDNKPVDDCERLTQCLQAIENQWTKACVPNQKIKTSRLKNTRRK